MIKMKKINDDDSYIRERFDENLLSLPIPIKYECRKNNKV